ncbi:MAG TPA: type II toxin-antitoxin system Phd/YefM family antitoxin [Kribbellaceae bacterium]|nr:type II toxin-antitoxin system Phd/YefM family antitoxin [Kribbellaceae bacterium]
MRTVPLSEAKEQLSALVDAADRTHEIVQITKHGRPAAVLMSADDLESLQETIYWLSQPGVRDDIAEARRDLADGRTVSGADLRARYGLPPR